MNKYDGNYVRYKENIDNIFKEKYKMATDNYIETKKQLDKYKNIIDELEKDIKKEIKRTEELILEDGGLIEITNIRKMLNDERKNMLFKLDKLKELKGDE